MSTLRIAYVHGIHGKPPAEVYRAEWDAALRRLAYVREIDSTMMYWSDIRLGLTPEAIAAAHAHARRHGEHRFGRLRPQTNSALGYLISLVLHVADPAIRRITKQLLTEVYLYFYGNGAGGRPRCDPRSDGRDDAVGAAAGDRRALVGVGDRVRLSAPARVLRRDRRTDHVRISARTGLRAGAPGDEGVPAAGAALAQRLRCDGRGCVARPADLERPARAERRTPDPRFEIASLYDEQGRRDSHSWYGYLMSEPVQNELFRDRRIVAQLWGAADVPAPGG